MRVEVNDRPDPVDLCDLREAVGYSRAEEDYPAAFSRYSTTASAYDEADHLMGWCSAVSDGARHAFIVDVIVSPEHQRQGIGRELLLRVVDGEREKGISIIHADFARPEAGFYERCGFRIGLAGILSAKD